MSKPEEAEPSEELIQQVAAVMSSMSAEEQRKLAASLHMTLAELTEVIENWRRSRQ